MSGQTGWEMVNNALNFPYNQWEAKAEGFLRRCDEFLSDDQLHAFGIKTTDPDAEARSRQERKDEVLVLGIIKKTLPAKALGFYERNEAKKRFVNRGVIKRQKNKWKILKDV